MTIQAGYCTQNNGDCPSCALVNYGRDCANNKLHYLGTLANAITGGDLCAMAKLCNNAGMRPMIDTQEGQPDPDTFIPRPVMLGLYAMQAEGKTKINLWKTIR